MRQSAAVCGEGAPPPATTPTALTCSAWVERLSADKQAEQLQQVPVAEGEQAAGLGAMDADQPADQPAARAAARCGQPRRAASVCMLDEAGPLAAQVNQREWASIGACGRGLYCTAVLSCTLCPASQLRKPCAPQPSLLLCHTCSRPRAISRRRARCSPAEHRHRQHYGGWQQ